MFYQYYIRFQNTTLDWTKVNFTRTASEYLCPESGLLTMLPMVVFSTKELISNNRLKYKRDIKPEMNLIQFINADGNIGYS